MKIHQFFVFLAVILVMVWTVSPAQGIMQTAETPSAQHSSANATGTSSQETSAQQLTHASNEAAGRPDALAQKEGNKKEAEEDNTAQFKHSPSVAWLARKTGLSLEGAYWVSFAINFLIVLVLVVIGLKSNLPKMLRSRTQDIQRGIEEARRASEDAGHRLSAVEERLSKLNVSISELQAQAEAESRSEEQRIWAAAEEEKRKIVQAAEQEIAAAANAARRELKMLAVELAMANAEKQIQVDPNQDKQLVQDFVEQLGEQASSNGRKS